MPEHRHGRVGQLWAEFIRLNPERNRDGAMFVRILAHVANEQTESMPERRFIKKWQHHYFGSAPDELDGRSIENGKLVYEQAACNRCHTIRDLGAMYSPDLTEVTKRFRGSKLLQQVVNPSSEIHKEFQTQMILVDDGRLLTGLVIEETNEQLRLCPNLLKPDKIETVAKSSIEHRKIAEVSSMPEGLLDTFTVEEILDLLAYIQNSAK